MCLLQFLSILFISTVTESARIERDACDEIRKEFDACSRQAYTDYQLAFQKGDDGRPDWMARKSCNYMTAAVEDCGNKLIGDCNTEDDVTAMKDEQLKSILEQLQQSVDEWDSDKCPAVKAHIDRAKGEDAETDDAGEDDAGEDDAGEDDEGAVDAGSDDTGAEEDGEEEAGTEDAGADDAEADEAGEDDAGEEDAGEDDAGEDDAGDDDTEAADAGSDDTSAEEAGSEDAETEDAGTDDAGTDDAGDDDGESDGAASITASLSVVMAVYMALHA